MNTRTFFLLFHCCAAAMVQSQVSGQQVFDLGPKAGISSNDLSLGEGHDAILGWHGGLFARAKPPLLPGLQGELLLSSIGSDIHIDGATEARIRALALQMPVFFVFSLGPAELHVGGYYDLLLSTSAEGGVDDEGNLLSSGDFDDGEYGLLVGGGLHLGQFYAGVRYNYGLSAIGTGDGFLGDASNRQAQAYIGVGLFE